MQRQTQIKETTKRNIEGSRLLLPLLLLLLLLLPLLLLLLLRGRRVAASRDICVCFFSFAYKP